MGKRIPDSIKQEVCQRFLAGETNISKLAKSVGIGRKAAYEILKTSCPNFQEVMKKVRKQNAQKRRQQQVEAIYKYREKQKVVKNEEEKTIHNLFWANKCLWDEIGPYTEIEIARLLNIELIKVIRILQKDSKYKSLQVTREQNLDHLMRRTHQQDTLAMSRRRKLNTAQAVLLNLSAYKLDDKKQCLVYSFSAKRPADLPKRLPLRAFLEYYHYVTKFFDEHDQKSRETDPARKTEDPQD
jgi:hypothetical protein